MAEVVRCVVCGHEEPLRLSYGTRAPWPTHCGQSMKWLECAALRLASEGSET